jgi:hydrogenase nickel incorporation protein HypA/HybF
VHEFGIAERVLDTVRRRAAGRQVSRVRVRAGIRHGIDGPAMAQAFRFVAQGTEAAGAALDLVTVPARITCRTCGRRTDAYDALACCPGCAGDAIDWSGGDELVLESLTYAVAQP